MSAYPSLSKVEQVALKMLEIETDGNILRSAMTNEKSRDEMLSSAFALSYAFFDMSKQFDRKI